MKKKNLLTIFLLAIIIISFSLNAIAHNNTQIGVLDSTIEGNWVLVGKESNGWRIIENKHLGSNTITYSFDNTIQASDKAFFYAAADVWMQSYPGITITETQNGMLTITKTYMNPINSLYTYGTVDSNGHFTSATIYINTVQLGTLDEYMIAHEIGHVIGLYDLYEDSNINKLMYGSYSSMPATAPSEEELWGVRILQGLHDTHEWLYTNSKKRCYYCGGEKTEQHHYVWSQYNSMYHKGTCSDCGAVVYERHYHYHNNLLGCLRCGYNGPIAQNVPEPELYE